MRCVPVQVSGLDSPLLTWAGTQAGRIHCEEEPARALSHTACSCQLNERCVHLTCALERNFVLSVGPVQNKFDSECVLCRHVHKSALGRIAHAVQDVSLSSQWAPRPPHVCTRTKPITRHSQAKMCVPHVHKSTLERIAH